MRRRSYYSLAVLVLLALSAACLTAAEPVTPLHVKGRTGRLVVKGQVGGEQHDAYSIEPDAGRTLRIAIAAPHGRVSFAVCDSDHYADAEPVRFGKRSADGFSWEGLIPERKVYYIYVTAYPEAHYKLSVSVKREPAHD